MTYGQMLVLIIFPFFFLANVYKGTTKTCICWHNYVYYVEHVGFFLNFHFKIIILINVCIDALTSLNFVTRNICSHFWNRWLIPTLILSSILFSAEKEHCNLRIFYSSCLLKCIVCFWKIRPWRLVKFCWRYSKTVSVLWEIWTHLKIRNPF